MLWLSPTGEQIKKHPMNVSLGFPENSHFSLLFKAIMQ